MTQARGRCSLLLALCFALWGSACHPAPYTTTIPPSPPFLSDLENTPGGTSPTPWFATTEVKPEISSASPEAITPIGSARERIGATLTLEGIATMYSGGFYAGSGNIKFYLQDESGGIQVQVFGAEGKVEVPLGARVRVHGKVGTYRGAIQIVPAVLPDDLIVLSDSREEPIVPYPLSLAEASNAQTAPLGRLVEVHGTLVRFAESADYHWMELTDEQGHDVYVYVDKLTGISLEGFQPGRRYRVIGILEIRNGLPRLFPRWQADLAEEGIESAEEEPQVTIVGTEVPIGAIQGRSFSSPLLMEWVTTRGIVTGVFPDLGGFWIQGTHPDEDPKTSEGIFINTAGFDLALLPGDEVNVSGQVRELYQQTALLIRTMEDVRILSRGNPLPTAQVLDPPPAPQDAQQYYEALEGMLVQVADEAIAISPTSRYGEFALVLPDHGITRLGQDMPTGWAILVDDGSNRVHRDRSHLSYVVYSDDRVSKVLGPLAFTFGQYKIEPIVLPQVRHLPKELPTLPVAESNEFRLMTWNAKNLFDSYPPHPEDPPLPSPEEYQVALAKVARTIIAAGAPHLVALQEVENLQVLEALASHNDLLPFGYRPVLIEGNDRRGIDVAYLVRQDLQILEVRQIATPEELMPRPPLLVRLKVGVENAGMTLEVINNHFTALSEEESESQPQQTAQAAWNAEIVKSILATEPQACLAVVGDLNAFPDSPPIQTLLQAGLEDPFGRLPEIERYTYIHQGISQTLDYVLVTPCLMQLVKRAEVLRLNADFPPPLSWDTSPEHKSDHDPVVVTFSLP